MVFLISLVNLSIRHLQMIVFPTPNSMVFLFHRVGTTQDSGFVYAFEFFYSYISLGVSSVNRYWRIIWEWVYNAPHYV